MLDIEAVRAFATVADLRSFTRAAEALGTTQSAISLRLKKLEEQLQVRLLDRTPRSVRISTEGTKFLEYARELLAAHDRAFHYARKKEYHALKIGISDHVVGATLPSLLSCMKPSDTGILIELELGFSTDLLKKYDAGELDAIIIRSGDRREGEILLEDNYGWFAASSMVPLPNPPVPLVTVRSQCSVRSMALRALDLARIPWTDAFVGGEVAAVTAAVEAGIGIAPLANRIAPPSTVDVGSALSLPKLPSAKVILLSSLSKPELKKVVRILSAAFQRAYGLDNATPDANKMKKKPSAPKSAPTSG
jgi:DNA-binding transcriptional LysR family regulator